MLSVIIVYVRSNKRREIEASCVGVNNWSTLEDGAVSTVQVGVAEFVYNIIQSDSSHQRNQVLIYVQLIPMEQC